MRTEIKAALVLGLFGILGAVIWGINSGRKSRVELPLDVSANDLKSSNDVRLASDVQQPADTGFESPIVTPSIARNPSSSTPRSEPVDPDASVDTENDDLASAGDNPSVAENDDRDAGLPPWTGAEQPLDRDAAEDLPTVDPPSETAARSAGADQTEQVVADREVTTPVQRQPMQDEPLEPERGASRLSALNASPSTALTYMVQEGDNFTSIARAKYGHDKYWKAIRDANPGLDPKKIQDNKPINLPTPAAIAAIDRKSSPAAKADTPARAGAIRAQRGTYIVEPGDSLSAIAKKLLDDESRWDEIYELNKDTLSSPDHVVDGTVLRIPERGPKKTD